MLYLWLQVCEDNFSTFICISYDYIRPMNGNPFWINWIAWNGNTVELVETYLHKNVSEVRSEHAYKMCVGCYGNK